MYRMKNILVLEDWETISKRDGKIMIDNTPIDNEHDVDKINRTISRIEDKNIDWFCGGNKNLEQAYDSIIRPIGDRPKLYDFINPDCGYVSFEEMGLNLDEIRPIFGLHPDDIGKGEVLLPCIFSDVRMKNREEREKGDCAIVDNDNSTLYHIEVKSAGSGFTYFDVSDEEKYNYAYSITKHIVSRYQRDKNDKNETIFIFFDNGLEKRIGNNNVKGFWWINVGRLTQANKNIQIEEISSRLKNHINDEYGDVISKSNGSSFAVSSNENGITIHPRN